MTLEIVKRSIKGVVWTTGESVGGAALSLGTFLVMARILEPGDFGVFALATSITIFANLVVSHGFGDALIQHPSPGREHFDTAFWGSLGLGLGLAALGFLGAGVFARAAGEPAVAPVLQWLAPTIPLVALGAVQTAIFRRRLAFLSLATRTMIGRAAGSATAIGMAIGGFGLWSLVGQQIVAGLAIAIALSLGCGWRPSFAVSFARFRELGVFGFHVSASQLVLGAGQQAVILIVGATFGTVTLGYFNVAWRTVQYIRTIFANSVYHVGFSAFSRLQDDRPAVLAGFLKATELSCLVGLPVAVGLSLVSEPLVEVLFGARWSGAAALLSILAVGLVPGFFGMFLSACYRALDRPEIVLWMSLANLAIGLAGVIGLAWAGVEAVAFAWAVHSIVLIPAHIYVIGRILGSPGERILRTALAPSAATGIMAAALMAMQAAIGETYSSSTLLAATVATGAAVYVVAAIVVAPDHTRVAVNALRVMAAPARRETD